MMNKMRKMKNKKGFTLMEMLIVVAIIAILIAIAIPTFASSLNKARIATDEANMRSGYASVMVKMLDPDNAMNTEATGTGTVVTYYLQKDGSVAAAQDGDTYLCQGNADADASVGGVTVTKWTKGQAVQYNYNTKTGVVEIKAVAANG